MNDRMRIKVRETVDKYQYRYQVRNVTKKIIPDNYPELFEKFGFNIVSIYNLHYIIQKNKRNYLTGIPGG